MAKLFRIFAALLFVSLSAMSSIASATNYTLWVNGRGGGGVVGDYTSFTYWGPSATAAGINKKQLTGMAITVLLPKMAKSATHLIASVLGLTGAT